MVNNKKTNKHTSHKPDQNKPNGEQPEINQTPEEILNTGRKFKEGTPEKTVITESINDLHLFCEKNTSNIPSGCVEEFGKYAGFETSPKLTLSNKTKIRKASDLEKLRAEFIEKNKDKYPLTEDQNKQITTILKPQYVPTERLLITSAIKKFKRELPDDLHPAFEAQFSLPIDAYSENNNLETFQKKWKNFLRQHRKDIDRKTAKTLDKIIIVEKDINNEASAEGIEQTSSKANNDHIGIFRRNFDKLASYELFEKQEEKIHQMAKQIENVAESYKGFPPYLNQLFMIYPYNYQEICSKDGSFGTKYTTQTQKIQTLESQLTDSNTPENERENIREEIKNQQKILEKIKREGYANYISNSEKNIGPILKNLIEANFDISLLNQADQQTLLNILVKHKLKKVVDTDALSTIGINESEYQTFIENLFDLNKKEINFPSRQGPIPIHFNNKSFLGGPLNHLMTISNSGQLIAELKNLPLNFDIKIDETNKFFFENNELFGELFTKFNSKNNGEIKLNEAYKVRIKSPSGKFAEGYLSPYPPTAEIKALTQTSAKNESPVRYMYSKPITRPEDDRTLATWNNDNNNPVVIKTEEENKYDIDILSKDINLNGESIGTLLLGYTLGQYYLNNHVTPEEEKKLEEKFKKLDTSNIYKDLVDHNPEEKKEKQKEVVEEKDNYQEFLGTRQELKGYQTPEKKDSNNKITNTCGFENGAKLLINMEIDSGYPPIGSFQYMTMNIGDIDRKKGTFSVTCYGGENKIGKYEGFKRTLPLSKEGLEHIKESFGTKIYKFPPIDKKTDLNEMINIVKQSEITNPDQSFKNIKYNQGKLMMNIGKEQDEEVTHFGFVETLPGEDQGKESECGYMYKLKHDADNKRYTLTLNDNEKDSITLDYQNFIVFIADKKLQPKTKESAQKITPTKDSTKTAPVPEQKKWNMFSVNNVVGFFTGIGKKINDGLKKYDDEKTEELTDQMMGEGGTISKLAGLFPSERRASALGGIGKEYLAERDNRVWKKIEKFQKYYLSDPDFGSKKMRTAQIAPYLDGSKPFKNHWQAAGMLLATIEKGKGPYSRNTDRAGKGMWIKILFGEEHQKRYLLMKEKLQRELEQGYSIHGQVWADDHQNEILKLEMKYITHCIDGRQLRVSEEDTTALEAKYSKAFAGKVEEASNKFFKETNNYGKEKDYNFELARFEYFRLLGDRPQQAVPCLKALACKAVTPLQWKVFESAVLTGMLSGVFYSMTQEDKSMVQKVCRTIGFLPGMWIKDPNHNFKVARLLDLTTGDKFSKDNNYDPKKFSFGNMESMDQVKAFANYDKGFNKRFGKNADLISGFIGFKGKNSKGKTLIEIHDDPKTDNADKLILDEIIAKSLEKRETVDPDVKANGYSLEQNILAKNESLIDEIIDFQEGKFKGKDKDEIQGMEGARKTIANDIPKETVDQSQVIYLLKKFFNWFEGRGFNNEEKRFLIRALLTIKEEQKSGRTTSADEILWYTIVGTIINRSGNGQPPEELKNGLEAFKEFFKANLETIIKPEIIQEGIGAPFVEELAKGAYKVAPWDEYIDLRETKGYPFGLTQEQRKQRETKKKKYQIEEIYINKIIYDDAETLKKKNYIPNRFKKYYNPITKKDTKALLHETLKPGGIKIDNPHIAEKIKDILSNKEDPNDPNTISEEEEFANTRDDEEE